MPNTSLFVLYVKNIASLLTARLHDQSFRQIVFDGKFAQRKLCQSYSIYMIKVSNSCAFVYIDLDSKDVLIGQFLSKSVKSF
jgi:hypothetical protein